MHEYALADQLKYTNKECQAHSNYVLYNMHAMHIQQLSIHK